jgi:hypothetical protein
MTKAAIKVWDGLLIAILCWTLHIWFWPMKAFL